VLDLRTVGRGCFTAMGGSWPSWIDDVFASLWRRIIGGLRLYAGERLYSISAMWDGNTIEIGE
jgi:hypothetical protein